MLIKGIGFVAQRHHRNKNHKCNIHSSTRAETGLDKLVVHRDTEWNNASTPFDFTAESWAQVKSVMAKYPPQYKQAAMGPVLDIAQRQCGGWLPLAAMNKIATVLEVPPMKVYEYASFYSMFNRSPIGKHFVQVCGTVPCHLVGAPQILKALKERLGIKPGQTTADKQFTLLEVECLGACANAPMIQIDDDYYEDLTPERAVQIIDELAAGKVPKTGPQFARRVACPAGGKTTLLETPTGPYAPLLEKLDQQTPAKQ